MQTVATFANPVRTVLLAPLFRRLALLALCAAYLQGSLTKLADFDAAIVEMEQFGLRPAAPLAVVVIIFELASSVMVISGVGRWLGALALAMFTLFATLVALRFWELAPPARMAAANAFFEHVGLAGAFVLVAIDDLARRGAAFPRIS